MRKHHLKKISWSCTCWNCWALNPICGQRNALGSARLAIVSTAATTTYVLLLALVIFICSFRVSEAGLDKNTSGWTRGSHSNLDTRSSGRIQKTTEKKKTHYKEKSKKWKDESLFIIRELLLLDFPLFNYCSEILPVFDILVYCI